MIRSALAASAAALVLLPAAAQAADAPSTYLSGRTFQCWQTFASYGPTGMLSGYNRAERGHIAFATDYVPRYMIGGEGMTYYTPKAAGTQGSWRATKTGVRFTSGPLHVPARGWDLVADVHPQGVTMPKDKRKGTKYQLVLRSAVTARKIADNAPPPRTIHNFFITPWYCQTVS